MKYISWVIPFVFLANLFSVQVQAQNESINTVEVLVTSRTKEIKELTYYPLSPFFAYYEELYDELRDVV